MLLLLIPPALNTLIAIPFLYSFMVFKIAGIELKNKLVLAPMYRATDLPFRLICREQGAGLCYSEMVNSEALIRNNKAAQALSLSCKKDRPLAMQVFGARIESMKKAAEILCREHEFDFLDLNLGCPSDNVINQGAGSALLKRPKRIFEIITAWQDFGKPVTAKIRSDQNILHTIKLAKEIERAGASAIAIHARPIIQKNKGLVDFVAIKRVKKAVGIPIIGNGGIKNKAGFERMIEKTGCDAVMVGTAAIGNPGIFAEILGKKPIPRDRLFSKYLELCKEFNIDYFGRIKQQAIRFFAGHKALLPKLERTQTIEELVSAAKSNPEQT